MVTRLQSQSAGAAAPDVAAAVDRNPMSLVAGVRQDAYGV
jgi:hypothetical protein